jgi:hypothetical protein
LGSGLVFGFFGVAGIQAISDDSFLFFIW